MEKIKRVSLFHAFLFLVIIAGLLFSSTASLYAGEKLKIAFLDVGEGESIFIHTPSGNKVLVDTGNVYSVAKVLAFLKERNIKKLDALIITHPHLDHMSGIFQIVNSVHVKRLLHNGQVIKDFAGNDIYRWYEELLEQMNGKAIKKGDLLEYGHVELEVLWPPDSRTDNFNENSLVMRVRYGKTSFLLMGDASQRVEGKLLREGTLGTNILKVGHHGAADSSGADFLKALSPEYAVISINKNNIRGYPHESVLKRLKSTGATILKTYESGNLLFESDGNRVSYVNSGE